MTVRKVLFSLFIIFVLFFLSTLSIPEIYSGIAYAYDDQDDSGGDDIGYGGDENYDDQPPGSDNSGYDDDCDGGLGCDGGGGNSDPTATQRAASTHWVICHGF